MKAGLVAVIAIVACLSNPTSAASYDGNDLDGDTYKCQAGARDSGDYPEMDCTFDRDSVVLSLPGGGTVAGTMPSEEIPTDGSPVYFTSDDGKSWQFTFVVPDEFIDTNFAKVGGDAPDTI